MLVHHVDVSEIRVGQDDLAGGLPRDQVVELFSATMAMPSGYNGPAIEAGQRRSSMPGIWAAVKATASVESSWRTTVLKSRKSRPPALAMTPRRLSLNMEPSSHPDATRRWAVGPCKGQERQTVPVAGSSLR